MLYVFLFCLVLVIALCYTRTLIAKFQHRYPKLFSLCVVVVLLLTATAVVRYFPASGSPGDGTIEGRVRSLLP